MSDFDFFDYDYFCMLGLKVVKFNEGERESKNITFEKPQFCRLRRLIISSQLFTVP